MFIQESLELQNRYIKENDYKQLCELKLCCCRYNWYNNGVNYLQQFICYLLP